MTKRQAETALRKLTRPGTGWVADGSGLVKQENPNTGRAISYGVKLDGDGRSRPFGCPTIIWDSDDAADFAEQE